MTISWLRLEQYHLGELGPEQRAEVEAALAADPETRARLDAIEADARALPPLDLDRPDSGLPLPPEDETLEAPRGEVVSLSAWRRAAAVAGVLAAAALALVLVRPPEPLHETPAARVAWKGGELAIDLDRQRDGQVQPHPTAFQPGDRFRVRLSCPPGERDWVVRVEQGQELAEPLGAGTTGCGNGVVLPGAFTLDGLQDATVCAGVDEGVEALRRGALSDEGVVCIELHALGD